VEHPLAMDIEEMRRAGYATVDALVARLADPAADPVLRRADAAAMRSLLGGPPPEWSSNWRAGFSTAAIGTGREAGPAAGGSLVL